ncbi:sensor histidine kinase [Paenibacillus auburnensis]|nr:sensor histidine kinase [Paenibacillus auburnensis]
MPKLQQYLIESNYKLLVVILLLVLLPVILLGSYSYRTSLETINDRNRLDMQRSLDLISNGMEYRMKEVQNISDFILFDQTLQNYMKMEKSGYTNYEIVKNYLHPKLYNVMVTKQMDIQIQIYVEDQMLPEIYDAYGPELDPLRLGKTYQIYSADKLDKSNLLWYYPKEKVQDITRLQQWVQVDNDVSFNNISYVSPLVDFMNMRTIGLVRIITHVEDIFRLEEDQAHIAQYVVLNQQKSVVNSTPGNLPSAAEAKGGEREGYVTLRQGIPGIDWTLINYVSKGSLSGKINSLKLATLWVCLASFLVLAFLGYLVTLSLSKKVHRILKLVHAFQDGDFSRKIKISGKDEFTDISMALNQMGGHMEQLIQDLYISKLQIKDAELRSLQAQINPHFLYNTLSAIQTLASMNEKEKLKQMLSGLAKFYRLTLNEGKFVIDIEKELAQVKEYLQIQQIKHEHLLKYELNVDPEVYAFTTVKLILQPFVENCIEHAWMEEMTELFVQVEAHRIGDEIHFYIRDNGIGMDKEVIEDIFNPNSSKVGYGIINVNERIQLQFGESYGVTISSSPGGGTVVHIRVPAMLSRNYSEEETLDD